jgi:hypothetical protein
VAMGCKDVFKARSAYRMVESIKDPSWSGSCYTSQARKLKNTSVFYVFDCQVSLDSCDTLWKFRYWGNQSPSNETSICSIPPGFSASIH